MRTVDVRWRRVAGGQREATRLQAELKQRWEPAIERARERKLEHAIAAWEERRRAAERNLEQQLIAWRACEEERRRELERRYAAWEEQRAQIRARVAEHVARARSSPALPLVVVVAVVSLLVTGWPELGLFALLVGLVAAGPALYGLAELCVLSAREPTAGASSDAMPQLASAGPRPEPLPRQPIPLDVVASWWNGVAFELRRRQDANPPQRAYGDEGEDAFVAALARELRDDHVAIRNLLVMRGLDADVVLVGPTGIWVFEVKHWSGRIECRDGRWQRIKSYHEAGGQLVTKTTPFKPGPDEQWLRERAAIEETLRKRLPRARGLGATIRGGLVFSHPDAKLDIDDTHTSGFGPPSFWTSTVSGGEVLPQLTQSLVLDVVDALLVWHHRLARGVGDERCCAVEFAQQLSARATVGAERYCG